jgi:GTP cyclohydrolase I
MTEQTKTNAERAVKQLIDCFDDSTREGLRDTPRRYVKFLTEFLTVDKFEMTVFEGENYDEMVVVKNIPFFSLCEHHMAPFFGTASIAYIPGEFIVGLSKLPRVLDHFARRLQNQERITTQVADFLFDKLDPKGVAVQITARHLCVEMRGVKKHNCETVTCALLGNFKDNPAVKQEFFSHLK